MPIDAPTLYCLMVGTTLIASFLTAWERRSNPTHARELAAWATAYLVVAFGFVLTLGRGMLPDVLTIGVSNVAVVVSYGLAFYGVTVFVRAPAPKILVPVAVVSSGLWLVFASELSREVRITIVSIAIAIFSAAIVRLLRRNEATSPLRSQPIAMAFFAAHAGFYVLRSILTVATTAIDGQTLEDAVMTVTMFEGVLFSVAAPMVLLSLVREESETRLLAASQIDYLTGLDNRRALFRKAERLLDMPSSGESMTLMLFDLDHFKSINDTHGHQVGDEVIKLFSRVAEAELRSRDVLARLGGEEFALLAVGLSREAAERVAARISQRFAAEAARPEGLGVEATVSVGLVEAEPGRTELPLLMAAADRALYRAKALGRNRVERETVPRAEAA